MASRYENEETSLNRADLCDPWQLDKQQEFQERRAGQKKGWYDKASPDEIKSRKK